MNAKTINKSRSTRAPQIRPRFFRFVRYHSDFMLLFVLTVVAFGTGLVMWGGGMEMAERAQGVMETVAQAVGVIGFLIMLLGVLLALLLRWMWKHTREHFANGLLTPAILVSPKPLQAVVLANMSTGSQGTYWGLRRIDLPALPLHENVVGTRFPCSTTFLNGKSTGHWGYCNPEPLCLGSADRAAIQRCLDSIEVAEFEMLQRCVDHGLAPDNADQVALLDENLKRIDVLARPSPGEEDD